MTRPRRESWSTGTVALFLPRGRDLDAGGAGTAMRFLAGFLTLGRGRYRLDGNQRMRERPIGALLDAMGALGVSVPPSGTIGIAPPVLIDIGDAGVRGGVARIDAASPRNSSRRC